MRNEGAAMSMPSAFEIGGADLGSLEKLAAAARERDLSVHHHVSAMRQLERVEGVLLDEKDGKLLARIEHADRIKDLPHDQWREAQRGLVEQQQPRPAHQRACDREHLLFAAGEGAA